MSKRKANFNLEETEETKRIKLESNREYQKRFRTRTKGDVINGIKRNNIRREGNRERQKHYRERKTQDKVSEMVQNNTRIKKEDIIETKKNRIRQRNRERQRRCREKKKQQVLDEMKCLEEIKQEPVLDEMEPCHERIKKEQLDEMKHVALLQKNNKERQKPFKQLKEKRNTNVRRFEFDRTETRSFTQLKKINERETRYCQRLKRRERYAEETSSSFAGENMSKVNTNYSHNDVRSALSYIRKKEMSVKRASFVFKIPIDTLKELLETNEGETEKLKKKLELKSVFTPEMEQQLVNYAVKKGTQICAAKTSEERKKLIYDIAFETLDLNFFKAPPEVKRLKVFVKRDKDKLPFYVFKVTPSDCFHFFGRKATNITKCIRYVESDYFKDNCPQDVRIEFYADPGFVSRYGEYILPHHTEGVNTNSEKKNNGVFENVSSRLECNQVKIKEESIEEKEQFEEEEERIEKEKLFEEQIERNGLIQREELIQEKIAIERVEPMESRIQIEFREPILKEELNLEDWVDFKQPEQEINVPQNEELESLCKVNIKKEPKTVPTEYIGPEEMIVDETLENLEIYEFIEMQEEKEST